MMQQTDMVVKVSKLGENIEALSKKPDAQLSDLLTKAGCRVLTPSVGF